MKRECAKILIVDDDPDLAESVARILRKAGHAALVEIDGLNALELVGRERPDLVITDLRMPGLDGLALLEQIKKSHPELPVVMLTGYASVNSAVEAMQGGAADYLAKPFSVAELLLRIERALGRKRPTDESRYPDARADGGDLDEGIVGQSRALAEVMRFVDKVAATYANVLVVGESGTGKELISRTIHRRSSRCHAPFLAVNCGALNESLLESELFGHERGAFTGAVATKRGIFEMANAGTLLLDEIGETSLAFQTKLLRVVQEGEFLRVGATHPRRTEVRIISASNRDLRRAIVEGRFREDLFYRLSVVQILVPPLRSRVEDIPHLAAHFLATYSARCKKRVTGIHPDAMETLVGYGWPGNIRELENVIERAVIMVEDGGEILPEHLPIDFRDAERDRIVRTMRQCNWNRTHAARQLGIGRRTLYDKLARLGISPALIRAPRSRSAAPGTGSPGAASSRPGLFPTL